MASAPSVLITGASRGLGRAIAVAFAEKKYTVGLHYHDNDVAAGETADLIKKAGGKFTFLKADIRVSSDVNKMIQSFHAETGRLDVIVNNAGNARNNLIEKMSDEDWHDVFAVNLDGPFFITRAAIPFMRKQGGGSIVNMTSYIAPRGARGAANYAAAKAGLITLTKNTALEEGRFNIRANAVMPGFHVTDINKGVWARFEADIRSQHMLPTMPDRQELGPFVAHVAELTTVTGQVFSFESRPL